MNLKHSFYWAIIFFGAWVALSPLFLGSVGTLVFYSNTIVGVCLVILGLKHIMKIKNIK